MAHTVLLGLTGMMWPPSSRPCRPWSRAHRGKDPHQPDGQRGFRGEQHHCPPGYQSSQSSASLGSSSRIAIDSHLQSRPFHPCAQLLAARPSTPYSRHTHTHGSYTRSLMAAPLSCLDCVAHSHYCALQSRPSREAVCSRLPPNIRFRRAENTPSWPTAGLAAAGIRRTPYHLHPS